MRPLSFVCEQDIPKSAEDIAAEIANMDRWSEFNGYGPMPGIEHAEYEMRTDDMVGSRIQVRNRDGSTHVEEIEVWDPGNEIRMRLHEFSPPVSRLATHFIEHWRFEETEGITHVRRSFDMYPVNGSRGRCCG